MIWESPQNDTKRCLNIIYYHFEVILCDLGSYIKKIIIFRKIG